MENKLSDILEGLSNEQRQAVTCTEGPVLIVAGAGSGKTRVLTSRIAYILSQGASPEGIMALTFTKKAAGEMKDRIARMVGSRLAWKLCMGTFHSVFIRFLREYAEFLGYPKEFTIYDTSDSQSALKTCIKDLKLDDKIYKPKDVQSRISMAKNNLVTAEAYARNAVALQNDTTVKKPRIHEIYTMYAARCRQAGVMDFDDILLNMNILLRDCPEALKAISERFHHIMVDEYQDTNFAQYLILKKLAAGHRNICVVGDDSQSIYAFRGAKIENILNFQKDYPDNRTFRLEQNYRSTKTIVDAANSLISKNVGRIPKTCYSEGEQGEGIRIIKAYTEQEEALLIASSIITEMQHSHAQYQDFAILYRTNSQSRALEEALRRRNLPYMIYSGNAFYDRMEVKDMMAYMKLAVNPNDDEAFRRIVNKPARGIGDTSMAVLSAAATEKGCSLMMAAMSKDLDTYGLKAAAIAKIGEFAGMMAGFVMRAPVEDAHKLAVSIAMDSGMYMFYKQDTSIEAQARAGNIEELMNGVKSYVEERNSEYLEELQADGRLQDGDVVSEKDFPVVLLSEYLENVSLLSAVDIENSEDAANRISLMTIHSAKGLEFPYIYISGMEENIFPPGGAFTLENEVEEERRLFYVAVTRAKKAVSLSFAQNRMRNGKRENNHPSRFIREIDSRYYENPLLDMDDDAPSAASASAGGLRGGFVGGYNYGRSGAVVVERRPAGLVSSRPAATASQHSSQEQSSSSVSPVRKLTPFRRPHTDAPVRVPDADFVPTPILELAAGQRIEHNRFGFGEILKITDDGISRKAVIRFDEFGERTLVLSYAKIRRV